MNFRISVPCALQRDSQNGYNDDHIGRIRGGYGSIVDAGPVLFALTPAAQLVIFQPGKTGFQQVASYKVADGGTYAYPIVDGKRVFIKDSDSLTLWSIE